MTPARTSNSIAVRICLLLLCGAIAGCALTSKTPTASQPAASQPAATQPAHAAWSWEEALEQAGGLFAEGKLEEATATAREKLERARAVSDEDREPS